MAVVVDDSKIEEILPSKKFFVIRGCMKSGTNWVAHLLNLHPQVSCCGEFHWENVSTAFIENLKELEHIEEKPATRHRMWLSLDRFIKECIVLANDDEAIWVGDRTPSHVEPSVVMGAKTINLIRDGRDVLVSRTYHFLNRPQYFPAFAANPIMQRHLKLFADNHRYFIEHPAELLGCSEFVHHSALYWAQSIISDEEKRKNIETNNWLQLRYEELHRDTQSIREKMYRFLGVAPELAAPIDSTGRAGIRQEMPDQLHRKGIVGDWKNYMTPEAKKVFNQAAGTTLVRLGYADSPDW